MQTRYRIGEAAAMLGISADTVRRMIDRGREMAEELGMPAQAKVKATLMILLSRVDVRSDGLEITIRRSRRGDAHHDRRADARGR